MRGDGQHHCRPQLCAHGRSRLCGPFRSRPHGGGSFLSVAHKETEDYTIKDHNKLLAIAPHFDVDIKVDVDGEEVDRDLDEIAKEVAVKALAEWGKPEGELRYLKRAPKPLYERWKKLGVLPRNIDREVVDIMHRTHMGVDQDYKNILKQCTRASLADGWGGSMIATDLQDVMFGTPFPAAVRSQPGRHESRTMSTSSSTATSRCFPR